MKTVPHGLLIIFSGPEGAGKTTQVALIRRWLEDDGYLVLATKEPEDVPLGKSSEEFSFFCGKKYAYVLEEILPALKEGVIVLCNRYIPDTFARECFARKMVKERDFWFIVSHAVTGVHVPDLSFWFNLDPGVGIGRKYPQEEIVRLPSERIEFHEAVANGYREFFTHYGEYVHVEVDASRSKEYITTFLQGHILKLIKQSIDRFQSSPL